MWKKKENNKTKNEPDDYNSFKIILTLLFFIVLIIREKIGLKMTSAKSSSWIEVIKSLPFLIVITTILYLLLTLFKNFFLKIFFDSNDYICIKCEKHFDKKIEKCDCGGKVYPFDELEWVEEDNDIGNDKK